MNNEKIAKQDIKELVAKQLAAMLEGCNTIRAWGNCPKCGDMVPVLIKVIIKNNKVVKVVVA